MTTFVVPDDQAGERLDAWLAGAAGLGRSEVQAMIAQGSVTVGGAAARKSLRLAAGDVVGVSAPAEPRVADTSAPYEVVYEDEHLAVVAKPAGVVVHPAPGNRTGTLVEALALRMPLAPAGGPGRPGVVHRLDKDTSGLMVVAKTDAALEGLVAALGRREVSRTYTALVAGGFTMAEGRIEAPVGRSGKDRTRMGVQAGGRESVTEFTVTEVLGPVSLLEVRLGTGRTHQIRVHLGHIGHPVLGDPVYGRTTLRLARELGLARPFLHAARLAFTHPVTGERVDVADPLPADLTAALAGARAQAGIAQGP